MEFSNWKSGNDEVGAHGATSGVVLGGDREAADAVYVRDEADRQRLLAVYEAQFEARGRLDFAAARRTVMGLEPMPRREETPAPRPAPPDRKTKGGRPRKRGRRIGPLPGEKLCCLLCNKVAGGSARWRLVGDESDNFACCPSCHVELRREQSVA